MKLKDFKKELEKLGVSYTLFAKRCREDGEDNPARIVKEEEHFESVIKNAFIWWETLEGYDFWSAISDKKIPSQLLPIIAEEYYIVRHPIIEHGKNWEIGCQTLTPTHRKRLFKLLAKDLGYELEG